MQLGLGPPDRAHALDSYRRISCDYDRATRAIERKRRRTIELLQLRPGDTVLDVACGTGLALATLSKAVGPTGRVIGVEQSSEMIAIARRRTTTLALSNVILVQSPVEETPIPGQMDAVLFCYTHDVLRSAPALRQVFASARPGARVAAAGAKLYPSWLGVLNLWVRFRIRGYLSTMEGLDRPWSLLAEYVPDFALRETTFVGSGYIGCGTYRPSVAERASIAAPPCARTAR